MTYVVVEETLEMAGIIVFIHALLHYIDRYAAVSPAAGSTRAHAAAAAQPVPAAGPVLRGLIARLAALGGYITHRR